MKFALSTLYFLGLCLCLNGQSLQWELRAPMPERVANNTVVSAMANGQSMVYSFAGLDSTKACGANHLKAFKYDPTLDVWDTLAPLPDPNGGKIACGASTVNNKIYIMGGYHVSPACGEISSSKVHIFDPETDSYLADGSAIPVPIDDHVQAVWRDSLIYVVTGWSNNTNVTNVQIYNPSTDTWVMGTEVPFQNNWRVFGASGVIVGDTIYYAGGASPACNFNVCFPPTKFFRKGVIDPNDPTQIDWQGESNDLAQGYRMAAGVFQQTPFWVGGSFLTYNFDGIDYNGTGGVAPLSYMTYLDDFGQLQQLAGETPLVMDLRGIGQISDQSFVIAGGMLENQFVSNSTFLLTFDQLSSVNTQTIQTFSVSPNPVHSILSLSIGDGRYQIFNIMGQTVLEGALSNGRIDVEDLPQGSYVLLLDQNNQKMVSRFTKVDLGN